MAFSAHLIDQFEKKPYLPPPPLTRPIQQPLPSMSTPFVNRTIDSDTSWMSHGGAANTTLGGPSRFSQWSEEKVAALQVRLAKKLGPEYVTQRPGPGGGPKLSYIEGWKVINLANEVFGFNGWSSSVVSLTTDFIDTNDQGRSSCCVTAIVRVTLADGNWHEDVGAGQGDNIKGKGACLDKAKKEAVTDAIKRALRTFGNVLGNCLYDKDYTKEVVKVKVPPAKFNQNELERRPEFTPAGAPGSSKATALPTHMPNASRPPAPPQAATVVEAGDDRPGTPIRSINDVPGGEDEMWVDENFDPEWIGEDTFMEGISSDHDLMSTVTKNVSNAQGIPQAAAPAAPAYQHRHRPDPAQANPPQPPRKYDPDAAARRKAALAELAALGSPEKTSKENELVETRGDTSAGSSGQTVPDARPPTRPVGGLHHGDASRVPSAGASARAQALANLTNPQRAGSPRIPSGGIDEVAARASPQFAQRAAALGLHDDIQTENLVGFSSARGMKRVTSDGQASPTKGGYRAVLGEVMDVDQNKRPRL